MRNHLGCSEDSDTSAEETLERLEVSLIENMKLFCVFVHVVVFLWCTPAPSFIS